MGRLSAYEALDALRSPIKQSKFCGRLEADVPLCAHISHSPIGLGRLKADIAGKEPEERILKTRGRLGSC